MKPGSRLLQECDFICTRHLHQCVLGGEDTAFLDVFNSFLETELLFGLELALINLGFTKRVRVSQPVRPGDLSRIVTRYLWSLWRHKVSFDVIDTTQSRIPLCSDAALFFLYLFSWEWSHRMNRSDLWDPKKLGSRTHIPLQRSEGDRAAPWWLDCASFPSYSRSESQCGGVRLISRASGENSHNALASHVPVHMAEGCNVLRHAALVAWFSVSFSQCPSRTLHSHLFKMY